VLVAPDSRVELKQLHLLDDEFVGEDGPKTKGASSLAP